MRLGWWSLGAIALPFGGLAALGIAAFSSVAPFQPRAIKSALAERQETVLRYPAESLAGVVTARDLFRANRRAAPVAYDPARGAAPIPDGPPKPQLLVTGIVWGDEPEAVVEGLPTTTGPRVVRVGDAVGGVTIKRIEPSRLMASGFDTTWTLNVRVPWK